MTASTRPLSKIAVSLLDHAAWDVESLQAKASAVLLPGTPPRRGKSESRRRSYYAGRAAVATLFRQLDLEAFVKADPKFGYLRVVGADGVAREDVFVNVSHTESVAVAAVGPAPVGIDVESATRDARRVLARVATEDELTHLDRVGRLGALDGVRPEIALWSSKEAFSKALGLGMKFGMHQFRIPFGDRIPFAVSTTLQGPLELEIPGMYLERRGEQVVAVCSELGVLERGLIIADYPSSC